MIGKKAPKGFKGKKFEVKTPTFKSKKVEVIPPSFKDVKKRANEVNAHTISIKLIAENATEHGVKQNEIINSYGSSLKKARKTYLDSVTNHVDSLVEKKQDGTITQSEVEKSIDDIRDLHSELWDESRNAFTSLNTYELKMDKSNSLETQGTKMDLQKTQFILSQHSEKLNNILENLSKPTKTTSSISKFKKLLGK